MKIFLWLNLALGFAALATSLLSTHQTHVDHKRQVVPSAGAALAMVQMLTTVFLIMFLSSGATVSVTNEDIFVLLVTGFAFQSATMGYIISANWPSIYHFYRSKHP